MAKYDVVVIGAGAAGLSAARCSRSRASGSSCSSRSPYLGGRGMAVPDEGFTVNLGGHLIEDAGSGLTKVFEHVGKTLIHGEVQQRDAHLGQRDKGWGSIRDRYIDRRPS